MLSGKGNQPLPLRIPRSATLRETDTMNTATNTTGTGTGTGRRGTAPAGGKGAKEAKAKRHIVIGAAAVKQVDDFCATLAERFGFKPTHEQAIGWAITNATKADAAPVAKE